MAPLPSIDPSVVRGRDLKNPVALALKSGSDPKVEVLRQSNAARERFEESRLREAQMDLEWQKEKFHLERAQEEAAATRMERQFEQTKRVKFARDLALGGTSPDDVVKFLAVAFPAMHG